MNWKTNKHRITSTLAGLILSILFSAHGWAQGLPASDPSIRHSRDSTVIHKLFNSALSRGKSYLWLNHLSNQIGGRLSGSVQLEQAVDYTRRELDKLGLDRVWLQEVMVPKWVRGPAEYAYLETGRGVTSNLSIAALGGSVGTPVGGMKSEVVEVRDFEQLDSLGIQGVAGKMVFFNRPMDPLELNTFKAYGGAVDQRVYGAQKAVGYGALAVIVRSMSLRLDDFPHTGTLSYGNLPETMKIPAVAISTQGAELLSATLKLDPKAKVFLKMNCETLPDVPSHNVIGEIRGTTYPDEVIVVGGHLDSWDIGDGAHDDGAGCVQSMEVLRLYREIGYRPLRTIRVVLFTNEENGLRGGRKYAEYARSSGQRHIFALESDSGGFSPRGFSFECTDEQFNRIQSWKKLFEPYYIHLFIRGGSGADIGPLRDDGNTVLAGLKPDSQRYFDLHHAENDTFEQINERELALGAASMASLVYLADRYGFNE